MFCGLGSGWLQVVVATQCLDSAFQPHAHFGLVDLHATRSLAAFVECLLGCDAPAACFIETLGDAANLCALLAANLEKLLVAGLDHVAVTVDEGSEILHCAERLLHLESTLPGLRSRDRVDLETSLGLL